MEDNVSRRKEKEVKISTLRVKLQANHNFVRDTRNVLELEKLSEFYSTTSKKGSTLVGFISQLWKYHSFLRIDIVIKI